MKKTVPALIVFLFLAFAAIPWESPAADEGFFYSGQIASFRSRQDAVALVKALKGRGQSAFYEKTQVKGRGVYFRVYAGKYASRDEAAKRLAALRDNRVIGNFLIHRKEGAPPQKAAEKTAKKAAAVKAAAAPAERPAPAEMKQEKPAETVMYYPADRGNGTAEYHYIRGIAFDARGRHESALKSYTRALEKDPKFAAAYNKRGLIHLLMGDSDLAVADHGKAAGIDPGNVEFRFHRGLGHRLAGRNDAAVSDFQTACRMGLDQACDALRRLEEKMERSGAAAGDGTEKKEKAEAADGK